MGLRQLYFLLGGLLDRLVYLTYGLAVILGFIGVKLIVEALDERGGQRISGRYTCRTSASSSRSASLQGRWR